jgi:hypothetical protein
MTTRDTPRGLVRDQDLLEAKDLFMPIVLDPRNPGVYLVGLSGDRPDGWGRHLVGGLARGQPLLLVAGVVSSQN